MNDVALLAAVFLLIFNLLSMEVFNVKNKLPNVEHGSFLVYAPKSFPKNSRWLVAEYYDDAKGFYSESSEDFLADVTHWCELPNENTKNIKPTLDIRHRKVMTERDIIISVYTNATGFLWSMCKVESGTDLGYSEYNGDCKASGSFTTYDKAFEDALNIAEKCTLEDFRKKSNNAHWSHYANFVRTL